MNTPTDTHKNRTYKGGSLNRIQAQWVADWLKAQGVDLPGGWTAVWKLNAKQVSARYRVLSEDVIAAGNGEKR